MAGDEVLFLHVCLFYAVDLGGGLRGRYFLKW